MSDVGRRAQRPGARHETDPGSGVRFGVGCSTERKVGRDSTTTGVGAVTGVGIIMTGVAAGVATGTASIMLYPVDGTGVGIICVGWVGGHPSGKPIPPP